MVAAAADKKGYNFAVIVLGSIWPRSRGGTLHFGQSVLGKKSLDRNMAS